MDERTERCQELSHDLLSEFLRFNKALQARRDGAEADGVEDICARASVEVFLILDELVTHAEWFAEHDQKLNADDYVSIFAGSRNAWQEKKQREVPNLLQTLDKVENEWTIVHAADVLRQQLMDESQSEKCDLLRYYPTPFWQPTATQLAFPMEGATDATVRLGKKIEILASVQYEVSEGQAQALKCLLDHERHRGSVHPEPPLTPESSGRR